MNLTVVPKIHGDLFAVIAIVGAWEIRTIRLSQPRLATLGRLNQVAQPLPVDIEIDDVRIVGGST
jgi:hypothetical protein